MLDDELESLREVKTILDDDKRSLENEKAGLQEENSTLETTARSMESEKKEVVERNIALAEEIALATKKRLGGKIRSRSDPKARGRSTQNVSNSGNSFA